MDSHVVAAVAGLIVGVICSIVVYECEKVKHGKDETV